MNQAQPVAATSGAAGMAGRRKPVWRTAVSEPVALSDWCGKPPMPATDMSEAPHAADWVGVRHVGGAR